MCVTITVSLSRVCVCVCSWVFLKNLSSGRRLDSDKAPSKLSSQLLLLMRISLSVRGLMEWCYLQQLFEHEKKKKSDV